MAIFDDLPDLLSEVFADLNADEGLGQSVTFTNPTGGTYSPATGTVSGGSSSTLAVRAVVADARGKDLDADQIVTGDKKLTIAGPDLTTEPTPGVSTVTVSGEILTALRVVRTQPGADVALYTVFCGKR